MKRCGHLCPQGTDFIRAGSKHTSYKNPTNGAFSSVPRHREIKKYLAHKICGDLGLPRP